MNAIILGHIETKRHLPNPGGKGFPHKEFSGTGHYQLMSGMGGGYCTWGGDRIIHWLHDWGQVLRETVFAFLALGVLVWVHTEGIDGILHGTEALVECQVLTLAQVLRDWCISWIRMRKRNRQNFRAGASRYRLQVWLKQRDSAFPGPQSVFTLSPFCPFQALSST